MTNEVERIGTECAREESIVLIGPVGAGKSLISSELSKRNNLPVITIDLMRHCPKNVEEIKKQQIRIREDIEYWKKELISCEELKKEEIKAQINKLKNDDWVCDRQIQIRTLLPNLPNYEDLGFNGQASKFLREKFGVVAWHFYQKQFENQLLQALTQQVDFACIIDMGGGMSISLDDEYSKLDKQFREIDEKLYTQHIDLTKVGFKHIQEALKPFKHIVELELPKDYASSMKKAEGNLEINELFIKSGQNKQLASHTIQVEGLTDGDKVDWNILKSICEEIEQVKVSNVNL